MEDGLSQRWSGFGAERPRSRMDAKARHEESVLSLVDALARRACARASPIRFGLAEREKDRRAIVRLRGLIMIEKEWVGPDELTDRIENDANDAEAVLVTGWEDDRVVAASRLVLPRPGRQLPTEVAYEIDVEPCGRVVDAGWFVVARKHASLEHRVLAALVARSWLEVRARGFNHVCAALASGPMMRVSERMGLKMTALAPARRYVGEERYPIAFDVIGAVPDLFERWGTPTSDA